jgi:hypothetical protein
MDANVINHNMRLAEKVLEFNPDMPPAYKSKFEIMSNNAHFATNVCVVICDAIDNKIPIILHKIV